MPPATPERIGRYRIARTLGCGAMGVVYLAHDELIERQVAIKLVRAELLQGQEREDYIERFRQEAQAAGRCNHPGIVSIFDISLHEDNPYLVMEFVDGLGLESVLGQGAKLAPEAAVDVGLQVLDALDAAHAAGIIHRDIKPANILLMTGGRVKVTDFGIARLDSSNLTLDGMVIGTPKYMSPEQCIGGTVDQRSDLFCTAIVLQEMLVGERPFAGKTITEIACNMMREPPGGQQALRALMGPAVPAVIRKALERTPSDRYPSARAMADALRSAVQRQPEDNDAATAIDATLVAVRTRQQTMPAPECAIDPALLSSIEQSLAGQLGPIARHLLKRALPQAANAEELCELLAARIEREDDRQAFLDSARGTLHRSGSAAGTSGIAFNAAPIVAGNIPPVVIEQAQRLLAQSQGPIAKILVKRTLKDVVTVNDLWRKLALHIPDEPTRAAFLQQQPD